MTVELTFIGRKEGVTADERATLFGEVDSTHLSTSSTSGTYHIENCSFWPDGDGSDTYRVHIGLSLQDADDSDYPSVKDDLAETVAALSVDFGTKAEIKEGLTGEMS